MAPSDDSSTLYVGLILTGDPTVLEQSTMAVKYVRMTIKPKIYYIP